MDITQLRYFLTTAQTLNYTHASEKLFLSRQALRQAIAAMEKELGTALFVNQHNKLSLTAQGEYLRLSGQKVMDQFDEMMEEMARLAGEETVLTVGVSVSLFPFMLPQWERLLRSFQSKYPHIKPEVISMSNDEAIAAVREGKVACSVVIQMPKERADVELCVLAAYPATICYAAGYPNTDGFLDEEITAKEVALLQGTFIGMGSLEETMHPFYQACEEIGWLPDYEVVPNTIDAFYRISHGQAVGFDVRKGDVPDLSGIDGKLLRGCHWEVGLLRPRRESSSKEVDVFCRYMEEEYKKYQKQ